MRPILIVIMVCFFLGNGYSQYSRKEVREYMSNHVPSGWILQPKNKKWKCDMVFKKYMEIDPGMNADYNYKQQYDTIALYITLEAVHGKKKKEKTELRIKHSEARIDTLIAESKRNAINTKDDFTKYYGRISGERRLLRVFCRYIHTRRYSFRWSYTWEGASTIETTEIKTETTTIIKTLEEYLNKK